MTVRFTPETITSTYSAVTPLNDNFDNIATLFDLCLMRDGSNPNSMLSTLDMNHNRVLNVADAINSTDATNLGQVTTLIASSGKGDKGDPGGNVMSVGTFAAIHTITVPVGTDIIQVSGTTTAGDNGAGRKFVRDASVNGAFVTNNPLIAARDSTGAGFREVDQVTGEKITPYFLVITGQSNAVGAYSGGPNPASPGVQAWNGQTNSWGSSDYTQAPWTLAEPYGNSGANNYALAAAHRIYEDTGRPVYVLMYATGGMAIANWVGSGTSSLMYAGLKTEIQTALATAQLSSTGKTKIDGLIWAQGEEDGTRSFTEHSADLATLDAQFRAETWFDTFTPIFTTGMSDTHEHYEIIGALQHFCSYTSPAWHFINTRGYPTGDGTHFTGPSLYEVGYRLIGAAIVEDDFRDTRNELVPFYTTGSGRIVQDSLQAISTFDSLANWGSRTDGPEVTDPFNGDGTTTVFTLTSHGIPTSVTVGGVVKATPADYSISGTTLTFVGPPPVGTGNIVVAYRAAINGPSARGSISWGYRSYAGANYCLAGGYLSYIPNGASYTCLWGRELSATAAAGYSAGFGFQNTIQAFYQGVFGRGNNMLYNYQFACGSFSVDSPSTVLFRVGVGATASSRKNGLEVDSSGNVRALNTLGYMTGSGGAVTQATNKGTAVTLNKGCGQITLNSASLAANSVVSFVFNNSNISATDVIRINVVGAASAGCYLVQAENPAAGSCTISVRNLTAGALAEALVLNFAIIKSYNA